MNALQLCRWQFSHKNIVADFLLREESCKRLVLYFCWLVLYVVLHVQYLHDQNHHSLVNNIHSITILLPSFNTVRFAIIRGLARWHDAQKLEELTENDHCAHHSMPGYSCDSDRHQNTMHWPSDCDSCAIIYPDKCNNNRTKSVRLLRVVAAVLRL